MLIIPGSGGLLGSGVQQENTTHPLIFSAEQTVRPRTYATPRVGVLDVTLKCASGYRASSEEAPAPVSSQVPLVGLLHIAACIIPHDW